jgi:hypothetical protein
LTCAGAVPRATRAVGSHRSSHSGSRVHGPGLGVSVGLSVDRSPDKTGRYTERSGPGPTQRTRELTRMSRGGCRVLRPASLLSSVHEGGWASRRFGKVTDRGPAVVSSPRKY